MTLKQKVTSLCSFKDMTLTELGLRLGMTQQNICNRLDRGRFTEDELKAIAKECGAEYHSYFVIDGVKIGDNGDVDIDDSVSIRDLQIIMHDIIKNLKKKKS